MTLTIRRLLPPDAPAYLTLRLRALAQEPSAFGSSHEEEVGRQLPEVEHFLGGSDERHILGAFVADELVGLTGVGREGGLKSRHQAFVRSVYVAPEHRRRGIALQLMKAALTRARRWDGVEWVTLSVTADQSAAVGLYRSLGFTEVGRMPDALRVDGQRIDELMMALELASAGAHGAEMKAPGLAEPIAAARTSGWAHRRAARLAWCLLGAVAAVALAMWVVGPSHHGFVLASLGGSTVFLFGLTRVPAAQPRALIGGHLATAAIGIAVGQWLGSGPLACAVATSLALGFMLVARCVHPPAGANPIIMVQAQAPWSALLDPVLLGLACLLAVATPWSRAYPGLCAWPMNPMEPSPLRMDWGGWPDGDGAALK